VITASDDGTARIWESPLFAPIEEIFTRAEKLATRELTPEERRTYLGEAS
jgi:hypothetical protein